jgi:hypothetical protein
MEGVLLSRAYAPPVIVELGTLTSLTATTFDGGLHFAHLKVGSLGVPTPTAVPVTPPVTPPTTTPTGAGDVLPVTGQSIGGGNAPDTGSVLGESATGVIPGAGGGSSPGGAGTPNEAVVGATAGGSGSGGSLPFTGFAVGALASLGAVTTSAGVALRRFARRR